MNREEIKVILKKDGEKELLVFKFETDVVLDLTTKDTKVLKKFFIDLLAKIDKKRVSLKLDVAEKHEKDIFYDVSKKYIEHLNNEIKKIEEI